VHLIPGEKNEIQIQECKYSEPRHAGSATVLANSQMHGKVTVAGFVLTSAVFAAGVRIARAAVHASIVVDAQTGEVLQSHNADKLAHLASLATAV
jgi:D-alanyl-D-alanine carboxypeptidase